MIVLRDALAVACVLAAVAAAIFGLWLQHMVKTHGALVLLARWHIGHPLRGRPKNERGWSRREKIRAAVRTGTEIAVVLTLLGLVVARTVTLIMLAVVAAFAVLLLIAWIVEKLSSFRHNRHYVLPLEQSLMAKIGEAPETLEIERDGDTVKKVTIEWAPEAEIGPAEQQLALEAVTTRLAIEAPDVTPNFRGRNRKITFTQSEPPPSFVDWEEVAAAVAGAGISDLVFGLGKHSATVAASLSSDSPHIAVSGGSGGGKSNLAAVLMLQELFRGAIVLNLDPKWISHLWLQGLPNVISAHEIPHLHAALCWLGSELLRRTKVAYHSAGGTGRVRANVGPRLIASCEELNYAIPDLKDYWSDIRSKEDPKKSPALKSLSALSCAGRASDIHLFLMAQMLTAASTGVSDSSVRGNAGIKCMARYDPNNWNMVIGRHIPMPPEPTVPGRIQIVTARGVQETQVPYLRLDAPGAEGEAAVRWAREFAVSGKVAELPLGEGGIPPELWPPGAAVLGQVHSDVLAGQDPETGALVAGLPPHPVTLRDGCASSMLDCSLAAARKKVQRAGLQPVGWDGPAALYDPADLRDLREGKTKVPS